MLRRAPDLPEEGMINGDTSHPAQADGSAEHSEGELFVEDEQSVPEAVAADDTEEQEEELPAVSLKEVAANQLLGASMHEDGRDLVEALLFGSEEALSVDGIASVLGCYPADVSAAIEQLNSDYEEQGRAFTLRELAGGVQLVSRRRYGELLRKLLKTRIKQRLSRAALETLAVIAYKQPLTKSEIEAIRGVKADGVIRTLLDRKLVEIGGRSEAVGRPLLYRTTRDFLEYFGLRDLDELPRLKEIKELLKGRDRGDEDLPPEMLGERNPEQENDPKELPVAQQDVTEDLDASDAGDARSDSQGEPVQAVENLAATETDSAQVAETDDASSVEAPEFGNTHREELYAPLGDTEATAPEEGNRL